MQHKKLYMLCKNPWPDTSGSSAIAFQSNYKPVQKNMLDFFCLSCRKLDFTCILCEFIAAINKHALACAQLGNGKDTF